MARITQTKLARTHHMKLIQDSLRMTIEDQRKKIEESHKAGRIPQDYSLGFINGLIFTEHRISNKAGEPVFYDRTTSIGALPKPVTLHSGNAIKDEQTYQFLLDDALLKARNVADKLNLPNTELLELQESLRKMDNFVTDQEDFESAKKEVRAPVHGD